MIRRILPLIFLSFFLSINIYAQNKRSKVSKEEFRRRQEIYLAKKSDFTSDEAVKFFPVFFELEDKKRELNDKVWEMSRMARNRDLSEEECDKIIKEMANAKIESDKLDYSYISKFRKIVPAKKLYKFKMAEMRFHREMLKVMHKPE